jgi:hypothetical protein
MLVGKCFWELSGRELHRKIKNRGGPPGADFSGWKAPNGMGKISTAGVLRLRATQRCIRDKSVRRSAQDDDFVGVLKKNIQTS